LNKVLKIKPKHIMKVWL